MTDLLTCKSELLGVLADYQKRLALSREIGPDYYEPGMMENPDQYLGIFEEDRNRITLRCDVKGLRYENRTPRLEYLSIGDPITILRDATNPFNSNNFAVSDSNGMSLGNLPAPLCNALAPLYDAGCVSVASTTVSYIEKISQRSRYAKQGVLFVELVLELKGV